MNILNDLNTFKTPESNLNITKLNNNELKSSNKTEYKEDTFDFLAKKVINKKDINDMVTVPRCIFKGYFSFTAGTVINTIASTLKNPKINKPLNIIGNLLTIYGTFNFVKPYLIKENKLTKNEK